MATKEEAKAFVCPECGKVCTDSRGLGTHRRFVHGVAGAASSTLAAREKKEKAEREAKKAARKQADKPKLERPPKSKPGAISAPGTAIIHARVEESAAILPTILGYAMGRLEALAEKIARENRLPEGEFVKQVAVAFARLKG